MPWLSRKSHNLLRFLHVPATLPRDEPTPSLEHFGQRVTFALAMKTKTAGGTHPLDLGKRLTVTTLAVEVATGPDQGARATAPFERLTIGTSRGNDLVINDPTVSRYHLELINKKDGVAVRDLGSKNGTWLGETRLERAQILAGSELQLGRTRIIVQDGESTVVETHQGLELHGLLGANPTIRRMMSTVRRVAKTQVAAVISGESGTGKELVARAIHEESDRSHAPFVVIDCGALTPSLITSALFGHEKGAFTGADRKHSGAFERAHGGTLFLDEVGELPLELQPQLLGVLERKRFLRVGGTSEIDIDVRVVAATNRDLRAEVNRGRFREDLYYRLSAINIEVPPLRERTEDLPLLSEHFLRETGSNKNAAEVFNSTVLAQMERHDWPGNVRELRNFVEVLIAVGEPPPQRPATLGPGGPASLMDEELLSLRYGDARSAVLHRFEQLYLTRLLETSKGNVSSAARSASMDRSYLIKLLGKHKLK